MGKGAHLQSVDPGTRAVVRLYHPRQDTWLEHFHLVMATGAIEGQTAIGRATVSRLEVNYPAASGGAFRNINADP